MGIKVTGSSGAGGDKHFWRVPDELKDTMLILEFVSKEEAVQPSFDDKTVMEPAWRFNYLVYDFATKAPIVDEGTGEQAIYSDRVGQSLNTRSNAYKRLAALLGRDPEVGEEEDDLFAEAVGKRCGGNFSKGWLKTTMRMPAAMLV